MFLFLHSRPCGGRKGDFKKSTKSLPPLHEYPEIKLIFFQGFKLVCAHLGVRSFEDKIRRPDVGVSYIGRRRDSAGEKATGEVR